MDLSKQFRIFETFLNVRINFTDRPYNGDAPSALLDDEEGLDEHQPKFVSISDPCIPT